jgi:integrase
VGNAERFPYPHAPVASARLLAVLAACSPAPSSTRGVLRLTLGWADGNGWIKNPCTGIKLPVEACEEHCVERHMLTPMQITALASILLEPYATLVLFIAATGVRIGEAVAVKVSDFDGEVMASRTCEV